MHVKGLIFDLDDTLYLEQEYVLSGFVAVANFLAIKFQLNRDELYQFLEDTFLAQGRGRIFNLLLEKFLSEKNTMELVHRLVGVYRKHLPSIHIEPDILTSLSYLKSKKLKLGLLTDGLPLMQKNKVTSLGLDKVFDSIVYSWEANNPKPSIEGINLILDALRLKAHEAIYIGDNPEHDVTPAKKLGLLSFRVLQGRFQEREDEVGFSADFYASNLQEIFTEINKYVSN